MATDYDAPRKTDDELSEDSIEELKSRRVDKSASSVDVDETEQAEGFELPGADLSGEELSVRVHPAPGRRVHLLPVLPRPPPQPAGQGGRRPDGLPRVRGLTSTAPDSHATAQIVTDDTTRARSLRAVRLDAGLPLPAYAHPGDAGADLHARIDVTLDAGRARARPDRASRSPCPHGYVGVRAPPLGAGRQARGHHVNAPGTVDAGYRGEILVNLVNLDPREAVHRAPR